VATEDATPEEWRPVPGYEGYYEASDQGRVRSLDRTVAYCRSANGQRRIPGRVLRQWTNTAGYPAVTLNRGDAKESRRVDLIVREAFDPPDVTAWAQERWLPVPGFEDWYDVSDLGRVRSWHPPHGAAGRRRRPLILEQVAKGTGKYLTVTLRKDGEPYTCTVHTLVLTAFDRPRPPGNEGRHGPAGRYVNAITNLCWGTMSENHQDRRRDGDPGRYTAKLTVAGVLECRRRYAAGETQVDLAREFGVSSSGLCQAIKGTTWAGIEGNVK
jgi:hypothetical protein